MHELALAQSIVDLVEEQSRRDAFTRVARIHLSIGQLAGVEPDALEFGFASVSLGTLAAGAILVIERPPGQATCDDCGESARLEQRGDACPRCGGYHLRVTGGDDLRITDLEVA